MTSRLHRFKTLFNGFPYISYAYRADGSILMQRGNPFLYNFSNGNCLADCLSHCFQDNLNYLLILKQSGSVADVVSDSTLGSDTDLVDVDGHRGLRLLDPLELVHGFWVLDLGERRCCWYGDEKTLKP